MNGFVRPHRTEGAGALSPVECGDSVELTVVMVVYRTGPALRESIARVLADPGVDEFVIIDNGSTPDEEALQDAAAQHRKVVLKRGHGNVGFAAGANRGAAAACGRTLVFLNPDAFLQPGCIAQLKAGLVGRPSPCIVGARVLNPDGTEQRGARRGEITPVTALLSLTRLSSRLHGFGLEKYEVHHESDPLAGGPEPVPTISGACFAVPAADFAALGGFDESYFLHVEDVDLCWRARQSGGVVLFDAKAEVVHLGSTSQTAPIRVEFHKGVGLARYFRKRADNTRRRVLAITLTPAIIAVSVARALLNPRLRKATRPSAGPAAESVRDGSGSEARRPIASADGVRPPRPKPSSAVPG